MNTLVSNHSESSNKPDWFKIGSFRLKAVLFHLLVSTLIVVTVCAIALFVWFPYPLFLIDGTWIALVTLAVVDLSLGPLITLIISSDKKSVKELVFDFSIVLCVQLAALGFGLLKIHEQRIVAFVHMEDVFHLVAAHSVPTDYLDADLPRYEGKHYGMLLHTDFAGMTPAEMEITMYNPEKYHLLDSDKINKTTMLNEKVPVSVLEKHGEDAIYKLILGKNRHGIAVLDKSMSIIGLYLAKE